ncbi:MAG: peptidylprolyl isomerase [Bacteroidetes bacterium]|nr:peptidylprolyl isomerase [Bacteroidota bacterium]
MKRIILKSFLILACSSILSHVSAQSNDPVLLKVADESITRGEFLKVYQKNNTKGEAIERKALEEYLDLFINFRLKVTEAEKLGMDTIKSFTDELSSYRKQLAQPYLADDKKTDALIHEAYNRKQLDIRASHILVKVDRLASAADTLAAWNKIMQLRKRIMKGEDFGKVAAEASEDQSANDRTAEGRKIKGNHGDLGYFTAFDMVYPFENIAYNSNVGDVSMPIRSDYGYHLVKVTDKLPSMGKVQLAHIILIFPKNATVDDSLKVADSANIAYNMLKNGADFATVVKKFSDDKSTAEKGGILPWVGVNRMLPEFIVNISKLRKVGDYSEPFESEYGWHIIKLNDRKPVGTFEDEKEEIKQKITKNDRALDAQASFIKKTKDEYGYHEDLAAVKELSTSVTDSIFTASWKASEAAQFTKPIFTIGTQTFTQADFAKHLATTQKKTIKKDIEAFVTNQYRDYSNDKVMKYADNQLENKYPDFKSLMKEYHDGILLFDLTDKKVWSKAVKDTVGLQDYYEKNKNNYLWDQRLDASIYTIKEGTNTKLLKKLLKKNLAENEVLARMNQDTTHKVIVETKKYSKGENVLIDSVSWVKGISGPLMTREGRNVILVIHTVLPPEPKLLNEARGLITSDYQNFLEKEWIAELRSKYPVKVNREVFDTIFNK